MLMTKQIMLDAIKKCGLDLENQARMKGNYGERIRLGDGTVINVYDSGKWHIQGRNAAEVKSKLERQLLTDGDGLTADVSDDVNKPIIDPIRKAVNEFVETTLKELFPCPDTNNYELQSKLMLYQIMSECFGEIMRGPGTRIISWTRYDGTPETLPEEEEGYFEVWREIWKSHGVEWRHFRALRNGLRWENSDRFDEVIIYTEILVGDVWVEIPRPPKELIPGCRHSWSFP